MNNKLINMHIKYTENKTKVLMTATVEDENSKEKLSQITKYLPSLQNFQQAYQQWQDKYLSFVGDYRLEKPKRKQNKNISPDEFIGEEKNMKIELNKWFKAQEFQDINEVLLDNISKKDQHIRVIIQAEGDLQKLPWHLWDFFDRYPQAEIGMSPPNFTKANKSQTTKRTNNKVKIISVFGDNTGINIKQDQVLLGKLDKAGAELEFLLQPERWELNEKVWNEPCDILFFSGHSSTENEEGKIWINEDEFLTIDQLKHCLNKSIENGLQVAIFNSCDGIGLAKQLLDLDIPQVIVMREPVPDKVAQEFLKNFLCAFVAGQSFYKAVREAREKLQGLEDKYPSASILPMIFQNPTEKPPTWVSLGGIPTQLLGDYYQLDEKPETITQEETRTETDYFQVETESVNTQSTNNTMIQKRIQVIQGDITEQKVDAIVNAANRTLLGGGGVDGAIHRVAGSELVEYCEKINGCQTGEAKLTPGYGLQANLIIHTVGPIWENGNKNERELLAQCYRNSLKLAEGCKIKTIAFPAISTGVFRFPIKLAAQIAVTEVKKFLKRNNSIEKIIFVCFSRDIFNSYQEAIKDIIKTKSDSSTPLS